MTGPAIVGGETEDDFASLVSNLARRDRRTIASTLSHFETMSATARRLLDTFSQQLGRAHVVGITGPPGAGKSSLVNALIKPIRKRGRTLGVIAVDPSSPFSGGAILGDRLRMTAAATDDGVFVRSLATHGSLGGITPAAVRMLDGFDAAGFDMVIMETVGTGQSEIDIAQIADVRIVVCAPGLGDQIQAMKSGLLEIADILVVNKSDRPGAEPTRQQLCGAVSARTDARQRNTPVLMTTAITNQGVAPLVDAMELILEERSMTSSRQRRRTRARYLLCRAASDLIVERANSLDPSVLDDLADRLLSGRIGIAEAATALMSSR